MKEKLCRLCEAEEAVKVDKETNSAGARRNVYECNACSTRFAEFIDPEGGLVTWGEVSA